jgi:ABC-type branched-subunit amino acid transport system substrate-binding protein
MHQYARRSLISVMLTAVAITLNHLYSLGPGALALGVGLVGLPLALLWWFRQTRSPLALAGYLLMTLWIAIGFGLLKGLWKITLPLYMGTLLASWSTSFPRPTLGTYGFEVSGVLMFVGSLFVAYYGFKFAQAAQRSPLGPLPGHQAARARHLPAVTGVVAVSVVVGAFVLADRDRWTAPANGIVRIGVIVPTSGPYTILGNSFLKAVQMAKDDLRGTKYQYELVRVDIGTNPDSARAAIGRAIRGEQLDAIVGGISLFGQVTKPHATAARIPHTCVCTVRSIGDGAYNFTNIPSPEAEAVRWVREAKRRGVTAVALLTQSYPSIANHVMALKAEAAREGLRIVSETTFDASASEFGTMIAQARGAHPDVYYVEALEPSLDRLAEQLSEAGIHNLASVVAPSLSSRPELFEGTWYTDSDLRDPGFKTRFEDKYPRTQFATHMMPYAYDDFNLIVQAFEHGQNPAVYIRNITAYEGSAGLVTRVPGSGNFQSTPAVWTIRNGRPVLLASTRPVFTEATRR